MSESIATSGDRWPDALRAALEARPAGPWEGAPVIFHESIGSTNDVALALAEGGAADGTSVVARMQTAGRGRRGRTWASPAGAGLYFSVVVQPAGPAATLDAAVAGQGSSGPLLITMAAAVAAVEAITEVSGFAPTVKWPNDLVVERVDAGGQGIERRKLGGILTEGSIVADRLRHVVVGVGINLTPAAYPPEVDAIATSIQRETGREVDGFALFAACRASLALACRTLWQGGHEELLARWSRYAPSSKGAHVVWSSGTHRLEGVTGGIDATGALIIHTGGGHLERVFSGEVEWR